ncbi:MAG: 16S rRNA (uracil(1498)-N(3))-methyltransferase [Maricaulaceae bacterium]
MRGELPRGGRYNKPMRENYTLIRIYHDAHLRQGEKMTLPKPQAHYLGTVLRKKVGDVLRLFNGRDGEFTAEITIMSKKNVVISIGERFRTPVSAPDIWLCFAPVRKHRTAFIIEKATELGVSAIVPTTTQRTQFPKINTEKTLAQIIEAAEQTERLDLPALHKGLSLESLIAGWDADRKILFADEAGDAASALEIVQKTPAPAAILIGPEGGFTPQERELLRSQDFVTPVSLGPRILRADTAALSLLSLWQAASGDWK